MNIIKSKKKLGQHFLNNLSIAKNIVKEFNYKKNILEIGPGTGVLTNLLVKQEFIKFVAIDIDSRCIKYLEQKYPNEELFMIIGKDQMCNLHNWYKYDYIFNNINIVCFDRKTDMHHEEYSLSDYKKKIDYIDFNYRSSSSDIKNKLLDFKNNKDLSLELLRLLDENVLEYIIKNKLYI